MVGNRVAALDARFLRLLDHRFKIAEVEIFQHPRKVARRPRFVACCADALDAFKGIAAGWCWELAAHDFVLPQRTMRLKDELLTGLPFGKKANGQKFSSRANQNNKKAVCFCGRRLGGDFFQRADLSTRTLEISALPDVPVLVIPRSTVFFEPDQPWRPRRRRSNLLQECAWRRTSDTQTPARR